MVTSRPDRVQTVCIEIVHNPRRIDFSPVNIGLETRVTGARESVVHRSYRGATRQDRLSLTIFRFLKDRRLEMRCSKRDCFDSLRSPTLSLMALAHRKTEQ